MIRLTKIAGASTILSMATAAVLLVGCGGGSNNAKQPSPTAQPTAGHATNGAAGKGAQSAAPSPETCTVKVAGHCVVLDPNKDPNKPDKAGVSGQSGTAAQSDPASGNNQPASKPRASATPSGQTGAQTRATSTPTPTPAGRQNAQPAARGQNGKPGAFSGQPSAQD
jgi:hypothetical protein